MEKKNDSEKFRYGLKYGFLGMKGYVSWFDDGVLTEVMQLFRQKVLSIQKDSLSSQADMASAIVQRLTGRQTPCEQMKEVKRRGISRQLDEASYYQDHYDEYLDDPEDELRFPPEIFDANDD